MVVMSPFFPLCVRPFVCLSRFLTPAKKKSMRSNYPPRFRTTVWTRGSPHPPAAPSGSTLRCCWTGPPASRTASTRPRATPASSTPSTATRASASPSGRRSSTPGSSSTSTPTAASSRRSTSSAQGRITTTRSTAASPGSRCTTRGSTWWHSSLPARTSGS